MITSDNLVVQYAAFTHSGKCYRQNQDALLLHGTVQPGRAHAFRARHFHVKYADAFG